MPVLKQVDNAMPCVSHATYNSTKFNKNKLFIKLELIWKFPILHLLTRCVIYYEVIISYWQDQPDSDPILIHPNPPGQA